MWGWRAAAECHGSRRPLQVTPGGADMGPWFWVRSRAAPTVHGRNWCVGSRHPPTRPRALKEPFRTSRCPRALSPRRPQGKWEDPPGWGSGRLWKSVGVSGKFSAGGESTGGGRERQQSEKLGGQLPAEGRGTPPQAQPSLPIGHPTPRLRTPSVALSTPTPRSPWPAALAGPQRSGSNKGPRNKILL